MSMPIGDGANRGTVNPAIEKTKERIRRCGFLKYDLLADLPAIIRYARLRSHEEGSGENPGQAAKQARLLMTVIDWSVKHFTPRQRKLQPIGPTVQLKNGLTWESLSQMEPEEIRKQKAFPAGFMRLPHVKHEVGGMVVSRGTDPSVP